MHGTYLRRSQFPIELTLNLPTGTKLMYINIAGEGDANICCLELVLNFKSDLMHNFMFCIDPRQSRLEE